MNFGEMAQQYSGTTLPKLIEKQVKSLNEETLLKAIRGTFDKFPVAVRPQLDAFTQDYLKSWFGPHINTADLGEIFITAIKETRNMATQENVSLNDEQVFDVFNILVMKMSHFAHSNPAFRKLFGIKKGWFS